MTINERIRLLLEKKTITQAQLSRDLGVNKVSVNQWLSPNGSVGLDTVIKLLTKFEDLNARWLILGEGEMLETPAQPTYELRNEIAKMVADELKEYGIKKIDK